VEQILGRWSIRTELLLEEFFHAMLMNAILSDAVLVLPGYAVKPLSERVSCNINYES